MHIFFIHPSVDGQLGCFHTLATINNAAMNMSVQVFLLQSDFTSFGYTARIGMLDHIAALFLIFLGTAIQFSIVTISAFFYFYF